MSVTAYLGLGWGPGALACKRRVCRRSCGAGARPGRPCPSPSRARGLMRLCNLLPIKLVARAAPGSKRGVPWRGNGSTLSRAWSTVGLLRYRHRQRACQNNIGQVGGFWWYWGLLFGFVLVLLCWFGSIWGFLLVLFWFVFNPSAVSEPGCDGCTGSPVLEEFSDCCCT